VTNGSVTHHSCTQTPIAAYQNFGSSSKALLKVSMIQSKAGGMDESLLLTF
jgi:hypothetical protein